MAVFRFAFAVGKEGYAVINGVYRIDGSTECIGINKRTLLKRKAVNMVFVYPAEQSGDESVSVHQSLACQFVSKAGTVKLFARFV